MVFQMPTPGPTRRRPRVLPLASAISGGVMLAALVVLLAPTWGQLFLFLVFGAVMALMVGVNCWLAHRLRQPLSVMSPEQVSLDPCRQLVAGRKPLLLATVAGVPGVLAGAAAATHAELWQETVHQVPWGARDPQFHLDYSFYLTTVPWYRFLVDFGFAAAFASLVASGAVHYLYGGLQLQDRRRRSTDAARVQMSVLLAMLLALKAAAYWLDRFDVVGRAAELGPRELTAWLQAKSLLCVVALICAALFLAVPVRRRWLPAVTGLLLLGLCEVLVDGLYPLLVGYLG
ncbi:UPF0182 family protein [Streptacidiphilus fuscans]|uniref:UPF0182 family protein n=1 Tax=Streptacidiphilus fuscans TaxID=2789292 RepID=A0A931B274_9ACTN|nr:UPF0182 family protein [Streptacidiphilus fuscans]MBF9067591.1 UPF0182 family protein [Streptacidiphilus fuscans]